MLTQINIKSIAISLGVVFVVGCSSDAIVYHERTRFGLNVEARPDTATPIDVGANYKREFIAVVPSKNEAVAPNQTAGSATGSANASTATQSVEGSGSESSCVIENCNDCRCTTDPDEAVSLISAFKVNHTQGGLQNPFQNNVVIKTNFATGDAAKILINGIDDEQEAAVNREESSSGQVDALELAPTTPTPGTSVTSAVKNLVTLGN